MTITTALDAIAIARWNVVPFQDLARPLGVGVVADHFNGILQVDFFANGTYIGTAKDMTPNLDSGTIEYFAVLDPKRFVDGPITLTATAIPLAGIARQLPPITLNCNANNTLPRRDVYVSPSGSDAHGNGTFEKPLRTPGITVRN